MDEIPEVVSGDVWNQRFMPWLRTTSRHGRGPFWQELEAALVVSFLLATSVPVDWYEMALKPYHERLK